jgi:hypothetical protein
MKRLCVGWVLALGVNAVMSLPAQAREIFSSGATCNPQKSDTGKVSYNSQFGATNDSTSSTAQVFCTVVSEFTAVSDFNVLVRDRNSTANVSCTVTMTNVNTGTIQFTSTQTSSGSSSTPQRLHFTPPSIAGVATIACTLPINAGATSSVVNVGVSQAN